MGQAERWQQIHDDHAAERPEWQALADYVGAQFEKHLRDAGLHGWVTARAKEADSFTRKVILQGLQVEEVGDRAGVRVVLAYEADVDKLEAFARQRFVVIRRQQKREALAYNEVGYLGVHLDLRLRSDDDEYSRFGERSCEVQLRTIAQSAWAEVSHEQLYKPAVDVPDELKRRIYRLVALVELFDNEVAGFVKEARQLPGYAESVVLAPLEAELRDRFDTVAPADPRLSREIVAELVPLYQLEPERVYPEVLQPWIEEHADDLRVQLQRGADLRYPLIHQPEILIIFERIDRAAATLTQAWPQTIPGQLLARLGQLWGKELDI